jgi:hypothetical protein
MLILLGINVVIAAVFGVLAALSSPSHTEREAERVRRQALEAARESLAITAALPVATSLLRLRRPKWWSKIVVCHPAGGAAH